MKLQKILRSSLGFSMVEITIAMGLLGLASLAVVNLSENVNTSTRRAETMLSKSQFASALGSYLYSAKACGELKGMPAFSGTGAKPMVLTKWEVVGEEGEAVKEIKAGRKFKNFRLKTLDAEMSNEPGLPEVVMNGVTYTKTFINIKAVVQVKQKGAGHDYDSAANIPYLRDSEYFFNVPVLADASKKVAMCAEEKSAAETCTAMRGEFVDGECKLAETCKMQGTYARCTGGTCPGQPTVNNQFTSSTSCPSSAQAIVTGNRQWQHTGTCSGKKCTPPQIQNTFTYYSCLECPGLTPSGPTPPTTSGGYGGGGGGCFVAGTQVQLYGGEKKNIEDVVVGDSLVDHSGKEVVVKALKSYPYKGKIYSINGSGFFFTPNHPFKSTTGWKSLDPKTSMKESQGIEVTTLKVGDILLKKTGFEVVKTLEAKTTEEVVYNFTVSDSHEYIADDFVVHNVKEAYEYTE